VAGRGRVQECEGTVFHIRGLPAWRVAACGNRLHGGAVAEYCTHYEFLVDPGETWWEQLVNHEYNECYLWVERARPGGLGRALQRGPERADAPAPGVEEGGAETVFEEGCGPDPEDDVVREPGFLAEETVDDFVAYDLFVDRVGFHVLGVEAFCRRARSCSAHGPFQAP
jgi:hypothetical protein